MTNADEGAGAAPKILEFPASDSRASAVSEKPAAFRAPSGFEKDPLARFAEFLATWNLDLAVGYYVALLGLLALAFWIRALAA